MLIFMLHLALSLLLYVLGFDTSNIENTLIDTHHCRYDSTEVLDSFGDGWGIYKKALIVQIINSYNVRCYSHQQSSQSAKENDIPNQEESKMNEGGSSDENEDIAKSIKRGKRLDVSDSDKSIHQQVRTNPQKMLENRLPKISYYDFKDALFGTFACCCRKMSKQCIDMENLK